MTHPAKPRATTPTKKPRAVPALPKERNCAMPKPTTVSDNTKGTLRAACPPVRPRPGSKVARMLALLRRPKGTTLTELGKATGWQAHSIRGFLSAIVGRKMGLKVNSIKPESGDRRYSVKP